MSDLIKELRSIELGKQPLRSISIMRDAADALEARDKTIAELVEKNKGLQDVLEEKRECINGLRALISQAHSKDKAE